MKRITFIDTEVSPETNRILDFGAVKLAEESLHTTSLQTFRAFLQGEEFLCGHNVIRHDMRYLYQAMGQGTYDSFLKQWKVIDTLNLSPLLFPGKPYHALVKDDKLQANVPHIYADSIQAKNAIEAIDKIKQSKAFDEKEEEQATRIIQKLISSRSRKSAQHEAAETRVDYIADSLGMSRDDGGLPGGAAVRGGLFSTGIQFVSQKIF